MEYKKIHLDLLKISKKNNHSSFLNFLKSSPPKQLKVFNGELSVYLSKAIVGQQLSIASAAAIWGRFADAYIKDEEILNNQADDQLRDLGFSRQKISYLKSLIESGLDYDQMETMQSEEVIRILTNIKGIGIWTAEIYCIFSLRRLDIFPAGDLALQEAAKILLNLENRPSEKEMRKIAESWVPYRSVCAIILWHFYRNFKSRESTLW